MKGKMVVSESCQPCHDLQAQMKDLIDSGEIEVVSLEKDPEKAYTMMTEYDLGLPGLVIIADNGEVIAKVV